jgi:hypothetical protein
MRAYKTSRDPTGMEQGRRSREPGAEKGNREQSRDAGEGAGAALTTDPAGGVWKLAVAGSRESRVECF